MPEVFAEFGDVVGAAGAPLPRHAGHRVHGRAGPALHAADPQRQAHRQGGAEDRRRPGRRGRDHRGGGGPARRARRRSTSCCTRPSTPTAERDVIAAGLPASPGAATGKIVFDADEAERLGSAGEAVILVREETSPGGHPRHARRARHRHRPRRHDQPRRRGRARHGPALRLRRRRAADRRRGRRASAPAAAPSRPARSSPSTAPRARCWPAR